MCCRWPAKEEASSSLQAHQPRRSGLSGLQCVDDRHAGRSSGQLSANPPHPSKPLTASRPVARTAFPPYSIYSLLFHSRGKFSQHTVQHIQETWEKSTLHKSRHVYLSMEHEFEHIQVLLCLKKEGKQVFLVLIHKLLQDAAFVLQLSAICIFHFDFAFIFCDEALVAGMFLHTWQITCQSNSTVMFFLWILCWLCF